MPDLLLELFSEEIPARMQRRAADDLRRLVTDALVGAGLVYEGARAFATPRRLALSVHGIPARSPDVDEERKGPRVGAPEQAVAGFLKSAGLASLAEAEVVSDPKKGDFYVARTRRPGRAAESVIAEAVPRIIREFPWPKSMRWGTGTLRWVRPLHSIVCTFGPENDEPQIIDFTVDGIAAGNTTFGHRFMAPAPIRVKRLEDYQAKLEAGRVVLDTDRRKDIILHDARDRAFALGLELIEDEALLEEVAGLNEWPVVLVGSFDPAFLAVPPEAIRATIRANQKCFVLRMPADTGAPPFRGEVKTPPPTPPHEGEGGGGAGLANRFVMVANIEASDGGAEIVAGNERVIRARLSDARHFWETDRRPLPGYDTPAMREAAAGLGLDLARPLDQRMAKLAATGVVFHEKLGTQGERVQRLVRLSGEIADILSAQPHLFGGRILDAAERADFRKQAERAAALAKADLVTEMVGEFPELQGLMGRYYAADQGEPASVAAAIEDHYKPQGPADRVPSDPVAIAVALADKLDMLVGFWAIDEKPTGSKDPYALRRAALGFIRILLERGVRMELSVGIEASRRHYRDFPLARTIIRQYRSERLPYVQRDADLVVVIPPGHASPCSEKEMPTEVELVDFALSTISIEENVYFGEIGVIGEDGFAAICEFSDRLTQDRVSPEHFVGLHSPADLLAFFHDRLKVQLREQGARHDLVDAVLALGEAHSTAARVTGTPPLPGGERPTAGVSGPAGEGAPTSGTGTPTSGMGAPTADMAPSPGSPSGEREPTRPRRGEVNTPPPTPPHKGEGSETAASTASPSPKGESTTGAAGPATQDDLLLIVRRVEALGRFLDTEDGRNLLAGYRRAANILRDEEKKAGARYDGPVDAALLAEPEERALYERLGAAAGEAAAAVAVEDFADAMAALARLRPAVDAFFDKVLVNAPDPAVRANRLRLLSALREATLTVADFSQVVG